MEKNLEHEATTKMDLPDLLTTMKRVFPDFVQDCIDVNAKEVEEYKQYVHENPHLKPFYNPSTVPRRPSIAGTSFLRLKAW